MPAPLILAIEPDHRQATQLRAIARGQLGAELVLADSAAHALVALAGRVPDLILLPALLSPTDEAAIGDHLRTLDAASSHVQTLIIPVLATNHSRSRRRGVLASLKRRQASQLDGCDPKEFAEQCATYLERAAAERQRRAEAKADSIVVTLSESAASGAIAPAVEPPAEPPVEALADPEVMAFVEPAVDVFIEHVVEPVAAPAVETPAASILPAYIEPEVDALTPPAIDTHSASLVEPPVESIVESVEPVVEAHPGPVAQAHLEPVVETPVASAPEAFIEQRAESTAPEEPRVEAVEGAAPQFEFIELDLSPLLDQLSNPHPVAPIDVATTETASIPSSTTPAAPEIVSAAPAAADSVSAAPAKNRSEVARKPLKRLRVAVKWTPVYAPPGRSWPVMEGVAVEADSIQPAPPRKAGHSDASRKAGPAPIQDEWGFFDPNRCGFTALLSKLDEVAAEEAPVKPRA